MSQGDLPAPLLAGHVFVHPVAEQVLDQARPIERRRSALLRGGRQETGSECIRALEAVPIRNEEFVLHECAVLERILEQRVMPLHVEIEPLVFVAGLDEVKGDAERLHAFSAAVVALRMGIESEDEAERDQRGGLLNPV